VSRVLLGLAGVLCGIVGDDEDEAADDADGAEGEEGIGGDVEADLFHGGEGPASAPGSAGDDFEGDLLVGGVFEVVAVVACGAGEGFGDLGGGGARVGGDVGHAGFDRPAGDGLVGQQEPVCPGCDIEQRVHDDPGGNSACESTQGQIAS